MYVYAMRTTAFPPKDSFMMWVSFEFRYGMDPYECGSPPPPEEEVEDLLFLLPTLDCSDMANRTSPTMPMQDVNHILQT